MRTPDKVVVSFATFNIVSVAVVRGAVIRYVGEACPANVEGKVRGHLASEGLDVADTFVAFGCRCRPFQFPLVRKK